MADVPIRAEEKHRREEGHVKTRQRLGWFSHKPRNAKGCQEPPEAGRAKKKKKKKESSTPTFGACREHGPDDILISFFWPPEL